MDSKRYTVYRHVTPSGKSYIGITSNTVKRRIQSGYKKNPFFTAAINKYSWSNIRTDILAEEVERETAECLEVYYIATWKTTNHRYGYNIEAGGLREGFSDYTRKKISEAAKKRHRPTAEDTKKKLKRNRLGTCHPFYCFETNRIYFSSSQAASELNVYRTHIIKVLKGDRNTTGGYHFCYIENLNEENVYAFRNNTGAYGIGRPADTESIKGKASTQEDKGREEGKTDDS